jgi:hypothetical protein
MVLDLLGKNFNHMGAVVIVNLRSCRVDGVMDL